MSWGPDYATAEDLAAFVRIPDDLDAAQMDLALAAASRAIDNHCHRQFGSATGTRTYTPTAYDNLTGRWEVSTDDLHDAAPVITVGAVPVAAFTLTPRNSAPNGEPWTGVSIPTASGIGFASEVAITGGFGWAVTPPAIVQATLLQASRLLSRRDSPYGVAGSPEAGSELRLLARLDPDVVTTLAPYVRRIQVAVIA